MQSTSGNQIPKKEEAYAVSRSVLLSVNPRGMLADYIKKTG